MFKKKERLTKAEFDTVFAVGKRHHLPHLTLIVQPAAERKVAVVAGKKVAKSAVRRNLLKRRVYSVLRKVLSEHNYTNNLIVLLKPIFNTLPRKTAEQELRKAIAQVLKSA